MRLDNTIRMVNGLRKYRRIEFTVLFCGYLLFRQGKSLICYFGRGFYGFIIPRESGYKWAERYTPITSSVP